MSAIAADLSPAERAERKAFLRRLRDLPPGPTADVVPIGRAKKPLGLGIVLDDNEQAPERGAPETFGSREARRIIESSISLLSPEALDRPLSVRESFDVLEAALEATLDGDAAVHESAKKRDAQARSDVARIELENAKLRVTVAELTAKVDTLTFISERLRVENAGPIGPQGPMGRDGHEGRPGARGERGERGETGPRLAAWAIDDASFSAVPVLVDGSNGPTLHLRGMFETYNAQVDAADAAAEADAARASRDAVEREVQAQRR
jgi:hypothetical protein